MKKIVLIPLVFALFSLTSCATILSGRTQSVAVQSNPPGANCQLNRQGRVVGSIAPTPGAVMVDRTKHDIRADHETL